MRVARQCFIRVPTYRAREESRAERENNFPLERNVNSRLLRECKFRSTQCTSLAVQWYESTIHVQDKPCRWRFRRHDASSPSGFEGLERARDAARLRACTWKMRMRLRLKLSRLGHRVIRDYVSRPAFSGKQHPRKRSCSLSLLTFSPSGHVASQNDDGMRSGYNEIVNNSYGEFPHRRKYRYRFYAPLKASLGYTRLEIRIWKFGESIDTLRWFH